MKTIRIITTLIIVAVLSGCSKEDNYFEESNAGLDNIQPSLLTQQYVPVSVKDTSGNVLIAFGYDPAKKLTSMTDATGTITKFVYDGMNKLQMIQYDHANSTPLIVRDYLAYNPGSQWPDVIKRFQIDDQGNETPVATINISYDAWGRKTLEALTDLSGNIIEVSYLYDSDGHLVKKENIEFSVVTETKEFKDFDSAPHPMAALDVYSIIPFNEKHQNNCKKTEIMRPGQPNSILEKYNISLNVKGMPKRITKNLNGIKTTQVFKYIAI